MSSSAYSMTRVACVQPAARAAGWPARAWRSVRDAWAGWRRRAAARRELRSIDERTLRDIGLSHRAAIEWPHVRDER